MGTLRVALRCGWMDDLARNQVDPGAFGLFVNYPPITIKNSIYLCDHGSLLALKSIY